MLEQIRANDDRRKADDHGARTHRDVEEPLLLAEHRTRQTYQRIGDHQTDDLHAALIPGQRRYHRGQKLRQQGNDEDHH